jgi:hypothetical protein
MTRNSIPAAPEGDGAPGEFCVTSEMVDLCADILLDQCDVGSRVMATNIARVLLREVKNRTLSAGKKSVPLLDQVGRRNRSGGRSFWS